MKKYDLEYVRQFHPCGNENVLLTRDDFCFHDELHSHSYYEIEYVHAGSGVQIINGRSYQVKAGCLLFFCKNDTHSYYSLKDMRLINCCFIPSEKLSVEVNFSFLRSVVLDLENSDLIAVESLLFLMENELKLQRENYNIITERYLSILISIIFRNPKSNIHQNRVWDKLLNMLSDPTMNLSLEEAASLMNISVGYFCRKFTADFGISFHKYLDTIKIQRAKQLLLFSDHSITDISGMVGYSHPTRFHASFKSVVGLTPLQYRKLHHQE